MDVNTRRSCGLKFCGFVLFLSVGLSCAEGRKVTFRADVGQALAAADAAKRPVVLMYWAPWCSACHALLEVFDDRGVRRELQNIEVVRVEVREDLGTAADVPAHLSPQALGLRGVPALVWLTAGGSTAPPPVLEGFVGPKRLIDWLHHAS